eukprot:1195830-Prorocentrum_minimum.AAC.4
MTSTPRNRNLELLPNELPGCSYRSKSSAWLRLRLTQMPDTYQRPRADIVCRPVVLADRNPIERNPGALKYTYVPPRLNYKEAKDPSGGRGIPGPRAARGPSMDLWYTQWYTCACLCACTLTGQWGRLTPIGTSAFVLSTVPTMTVSRPLKPKD